MGCQYSVEGKMIVKNYTGLMEDLDDLEDYLGEIELTKKTKDDVTEVTISGHFSMSYSTAVLIDEKLRAFGKHVVQPARFATECDYEEGEVWVGEKDAIEKAKRARLVAEAVDLMKQLTIEERKAVFGLMENTREGSPSPAAQL